MERIKAAAIKYRLKGQEEFDIVWGPNHAYCINWFSFADIYRSMRDLKNEQQGFLTNTERFVDRVEALEIAINAGQIDKETYRYDELYSEFVRY